MGSDGSHGPRPFTQRQARTVFLRVPAADWIAVSRGRKREFRASHSACSALWDVKTPTPVVAYRVKRIGGQPDYEAKLMVLERRWQEPLGAISKESLEAEGFESLAEFRRYWMRRERRHFTPTRMVTCYRVRTFNADEDPDEMGRVLFDRLYGEFLE